MTVDIGDIVEDEYVDVRGIGRLQMSTWPHLFRKLEWFEERDFDLTGMYIRAGELDGPHSCYKLLAKIDYQSMEVWEMQGGLGQHQYPLNRTVPITEQEYLDYLNKKP